MRELFARDLSWDLSRDLRGTCAGPSRALSRGTFQGSCVGPSRDLCGTSTFLDRYTSVGGLCLLHHCSRHLRLLQRLKKRSIYTTTQPSPRIQLHSGLMVANITGPNRIHPQVEVVLRRQKREGFQRSHWKLKTFWEHTLSFNACS